MKTVLLIVASLFLSCALPAQKQTTFRPATEWPDTEGKHINAHGGGILKKVRFIIGMVRIVRMPAVL